MSSGCTAIRTVNAARCGSFTATVRNTGKAVDNTGKAVDAVAAAFGRIDILVNSAGIVALGPAEELPLDAWDKTIDVNLTGTFLRCQAVGRLMLAVGRGVIVNMASQAATVALGQHVAYCASKFGAVGVTKVLAAEWDGPRGDALKKEIPVGRFAYPNEIGAAAVFLASNAAAMITGADLVIDGGYTIK